MVFERKVQLNYENLSEGTKLRFMELEIQAAIETLQTTLFSSHKDPGAQAMKVIASAIVANPSKEMLVDDLVRAFSTFKFHKPTKEEKIHYFRYKRIGVAKITKYAQVGPNTVQNMKDKHPNLNPVFTGWLNFNGLVRNWENLKHAINFFDDDLIQSKDNHLVQLNLQIKEDAEEVEASAPAEEIKPDDYDPMRDLSNPDIDRSQWVWIPGANRWMEKYDEYGNQHDYGF